MLARNVLCSLTKNSIQISMVKKIVFLINFKQRARICSLFLISMKLFCLRFDKHIRPKILLLKINVIQIDLFLLQKNMSP